MDEISTVFGPVFHMEAFRIANLRYEGLPGGKYSRNRRKCHPYPDILIYFINYK